MIRVDANLLLYAASPVFPQYDQAREWFDARLNGPARVGPPWVSLLAFLRISTKPRAFARPLNLSVAWRQVQRWFEGERTWIPEPTDQHAEVLGDLLAAPGLKGDPVSDPHLAALAIEHGLTLYSADTDFTKLSQVKWINPVAGR